MLNSFSRFRTDLNLPNKRSKCKRSECKFLYNKITHLWQEVLSKLWAVWNASSRPSCALYWHPAIKRKKRKVILRTNLCPFFQRIREFLSL